VSRAAPIDRGEHRARPRRRSVALLGAVVVGVALLGVTTASCADDAGTADAASDRSSVPGTVVVFAASSLSDVFTTIAADAERASPGLDVQINSGSSSTLAQQIAAGAPATVFASADRAAMERIGPAAVSPAVFATNQLAIAVPAGNPAGVSGIGAFGEPSVRTGLCAAAAPCGRYARQSLERAGITPTPVTEEPDVRSLLAKVTSGDLDAGLVYATDVRAAAGLVDAVAVAPADQVQAQYLITAVAAPDGGPSASAAATFVDWVLGPGQQTLRAAGFGAP